MICNMFCSIQCFMIFTRFLTFSISSSSFQCGGRHPRTIPISAVNDDFCDCLDGSDEPLTSACSYIDSSNFECGTPRIDSVYYQATNSTDTLHFLLKKRSGELINNFRLNDGRCDCCDGSDEALGQCENVCYAQVYHELVAFEERAKITEEGITRKQLILSKTEVVMDRWRSDLAVFLQVLNNYAEQLKQTVDKGLELSDWSKDRIKEVSDGVKVTELLISFRYCGGVKDFAHLVGRCLKKSEKGFDYQLCFFRGIEQRRSDKNSQTWAVESQPSLLQTKYNEFFAQEDSIMTGFDFGVAQYNFTKYETYPDSVFIGSFQEISTNQLQHRYTFGQSCSKGINRESLVILQCGIDPEIVSIRETSRCFYEFKVNLPIACGAQIDDNNSIDVYSE